MEKLPLLDDPGQGPLTRKSARTSLLSPRRQYMEVPFPEVFEEPGPDLLPEYLQILRRRKGTLTLIVFLGLLTSLLLTLLQAPTYQARASLEIQEGSTFPIPRSLCPFSTIYLKDKSTLYAKCYGTRFSH